MGHFDDFKMAVNYKQPPKFDEKGMTYEQWKNEVSIWELVTDIEPKKRALAIALTLTGKAKETALEVEVKVLNAEDGVKKLVGKLDTVLKKHDSDADYEAYTAFDSFRRSSGMKMSDYIYDFENKYSVCKKRKMELPSAVMAFKLLDNAGLSDTEKQLAMTACGEVSFDNMKNALKRIFVERSFGSDSCSASAGASAEPSIKVEPQEAFFTQQRSGPRRYNSPRSYQSGRTQPGTNPLDRFGRRSRCAICQSVYHWVKNCPNKTESVKVVEEKDLSEKGKEDFENCNITLFTNSSECEVFMTEAFGSAVIDTACTKTVCGERWLNNYVNRLNPSFEQHVSKSTSNKKFRFGDGKMVNSVGKVTIPAKIGQVSCKIETEVVKQDIPLLLSKESLKKAETILDLKRDKVMMFSQPVDVNFTSSGHYCVPITKGIETNLSS